MIICRREAYYHLTTSLLELAKIIVIFLRVVHILCKEVNDMAEETTREQITRVLPKSIQQVVEDQGIRFDRLQEIRLRTGQPLYLIYAGNEMMPERGGKYYEVTKEDVRESLEYISHYSLYAYENEMKQGFITIEGGHRVGMTGKVIIEQEKVKNMKHISSINIRVSHEITGCADPILPYIAHNKQMYHTLIVSPPRCGKTTLLRDLIRQISDGNDYVRGCTVGVVDERSEIGGCYKGVPQNQIGKRTDVLDCCPKAEGMIMLIRSMAPQVIAVDEIGSGEEIHALEYALHCGCKILATVHGSSMEELMQKPLFDQLIKEKRFERYVVLSNREKIGQVEGIYDERGSRCI